MKIDEEIKSAIKNTVGYKEAENKESFMIGANVAFYNSEEFFENRINSLRSTVASLNKDKSELEKDMMTLVSIISKYLDRLNS